MKSRPRFQNLPDDIARNRTEAFINENRLPGAAKVSNPNVEDVELEKVEVEVG